MIALLVIAGASVSAAEDPREIVRRSVQLDQANWSRMKDYTWIANQLERSFDSKSNVKSERTEKWETVILYGEPHRRMLERHGKPLSADEQRKEQAKLDKIVAERERETPRQRERRLADFEKRRQKERAFLLEIPELYNFTLENDQTVDGRDVWVVSATPRPGYRPKQNDAKVLQKIRGKLWIDKAELQWVRLEAETIDTISFGVFIARLNPGARLLFEQTRINDEIWLPKREFVSGTGRIGLLKKIAMDQDVTWSNYRKFHAESRIVPAKP